MPSSVGFAIVFSTDKPQPQVREQRNKSGQIQVTVSNAIEGTCNIAFDGAHAPMACFVWVVTIELYYAPDRDWKLEEEMQGQGVGEERLARLSAVHGSARRAMTGGRSH